MFTGGAENPAPPPSPKVSLACQSSPLTNLTADGLFISVASLFNAGEKGRKEDEEEEQKRESEKVGKKKKNIR